MKNHWNSTLKRKYLSGNYPRYVTPDTPLHVVVEDCAPRPLATESVSDSAVNVNTRYRMHNYYSVALLEYGGQNVSNLAEPFVHADIRKSSCRQMIKAWVSCRAG